jgi:hypothetical protein
MVKVNMDGDLSLRRRAIGRVSKDWTTFGRQLAQVLSSLEEDQFLILVAKHGNRFLQFSCQGSWGMRVEVTSNHFLKGDDRLNWQEVAWLSAHGWNAPTGGPQQATPDHDPDGSPNYYIDFTTAVPTSDIVSLAIDTLIHGLAFPYPGVLSYESFDSDGGVLEFQELGLKPLPRQSKPLMEQVLAVFRSVTAIEDLAFDEDGDLGVRYGAILVSAMQLDNRIRLFSALVSEVSESPTLLRKINQINDGVHRIRVFLHDDTVYAALDIPADPFVPAHLAGAINEFSELAEGLAIVLCAKFSGKALIEPSGPATCLQ